MKRLRIPLASLAGAGALAACQLLAGIDERPFVVADASSTTDVSDEADAMPPDPCQHVVPPPKPVAPFEETKKVYVVAIASADFGGSDDAGNPIGFDLDGVCTCDPRPDTAHAGASGCMPPAKSSGVCDHDGGLDNAVFGPFQALASTTQSVKGDLIENQIRCGKESLLLYIGGYNGKADDDRVSVGLIPSWGIRTQHDAGEVDADCYGGAPPSPGPPYPPRWDGTDVWSFLGIAAYRQGSEILPFGVAGDAYVTGFRLVVPADPKRDVKFFLGEHELELFSPVVVADLVGVDALGRDVDGGVLGGANAFRVSNGSLGARIPAEAFLEAIGYLKKTKNGADYFCQDPTYVGLAKQFVCPARDIAADPARDFQIQPGGIPFPCDAVSMAMRFTALPAQIGDEYTPDGGPDANCLPGSAVCP
jgi:hypothetical protein